MAVLPSGPTIVTRWLGAAGRPSWLPFITILQPPGTSVLFRDLVSTRGCATVVLLLEVVEVVGAVTDVLVTPALVDPLLLFLPLFSQSENLTPQPHGHRRLCVLPVLPLMM